MELLKHKICTSCEMKLSVENFRKRIQHGKLYIIARCRKCEVRFNGLQRDREQNRITERKRFSNPIRKNKKNKYQKEWRSKNIEKNRKYHKTHIKKQVDNLTDNYITRTMFRNSKVIVPLELIEAKRINLQIKRLLKQKQK